MNLSLYETNGRRSPVISRNGIVAASQPLAVAAGLKILSQGGSAADAAVATAAALNVCEPGSTGLGGDAFALYYEAASHQVYGLNGSGRAPAALNLERLQREGFGESLPRFHPYTRHRSRGLRRVVRPDRTFWPAADDPRARPGG